MPLHRPWEVELPSFFFFFEPLTIFILSRASLLHIPGKHTTGIPAGKKMAERTNEGGSLSLSRMCVCVIPLCVFIEDTRVCVCLTYLHTWCSREREREKGYCRNFWRICFFIWKRRWPTFLVLGTYVRKSTKMCRKFASGFVRGRMREKLSCIIAVDISASSSRVPKLADRRRSVSRTHRSTGTKLLLLLFKSWPIGSSTTL